MPRIAIVGTGANGAGIGADLTRAGHDVTFIEQWPAHVEAMREKGVRVTTPVDGKSVVTRVNVIHLCEVATLREKFDIVYVVLKAYDTRWGCELIKPLVADDGVVIGLQNGMTTDDVASIMGEERTLGGVIELGANLFVPGEVERHNVHSNTWFALGSDNPVAHAKADEAARVLRAAGTVEVVDDIRSAKWMKLVLNAAELVPSAILDLAIPHAARLPGMRELMLEAGNEAVRAVAALGLHVVPIFGMEGVDPERPEEFVSTIFDLLLSDFSLPDTKATVLQDWMKGRRSEVDQINGLVVDVLASAGQPAPVNAAAVEIAHRIERGELTAGIGNFELFTTLASR
ncbi:MAG TPA: 2-dehydropantoate 2-reductase N-terminal domain-containing protein [Terrimesophilobacter sp.]|nr:2-dehydropantoate 2-reductase N-terminal domain-containing protein [Terrimesophilobacter sp.]